MEDAKKRKLDDSSTSSSLVLPSSEDGRLKMLLDPLPKNQLLDLLVKLGSKYPSVAEEIKSVASADPIHKKLFVRGLAWDTTSETLCAAFRVYGEIEEGAVIVDKATGKSRGYGFITYTHMESAQSALREPSKLIDGRMAVCNLACESLSSGTIIPDQVQRKLYIGGLSQDITSEALLNYFGRHGEIEEGSVAYEKDTNKSRGFGFVTYKTVEAARKAIEDPNKILGGRSIAVKLADTPKGRTGQTQQLPTSVVPGALSLPPGYAQPSQAHLMSPPVGYSQPSQAHLMTPPVGYSAYPHAVSAYPNTAFLNHVPAAATSAPHPSPSPSPSPSQISYAPFPVKRDQFGLPAVAPTGLEGYPYYMGK